MTLVLCKKCGKALRSWNDPNNPHARWLCVLCESRGYVIEDHYLCSFAICSCQKPEWEHDGKKVPDKDIHAYASNQLWLLG